MEVLKEDERGDEVELCLELSIGGRYRKIGVDSKGGLWNPNQGKNRDDPRLDFSCGFGELEAQKFRSRLEDRENRELDGFGEELVRKRDKNVGKGAAAAAAEGEGLSLSLLDGMEGLYPKIQHVNPENKDNVLRKNLDSSELEIGALERSCSAVSDYQSTTQKGGSRSDTGSHSSHSHSRQINYPSPQTKLNHRLVELPKHYRPVVLPKHDGKVATSPLRNPSQHNDDERSNNACPMSSSDKPPLKETSSSPVDKPPKPPNHIPNIPSTRGMPCVTTTGNGPNGKTIAGFLYKYTNAEVVIMCVCHGGFFTPAEFVEHAGGIDVSHPLRHITVMPSPYG